MYSFYIVDVKTRDAKARMFDEKSIKDADERIGQIERRIDKEKYYLACATTSSDTDEKYMYDIKYPFMSQEEKQKQIHGYNCLRNIAGVEPLDINQL